MMDAARGENNAVDKLGDWLNFRQAIVLHGVLTREPAQADLPRHMRRTAPMSPQALARLVDNTRVQLEQSIVQGAPAGSGLVRIEMPALEPDVPLQAQTAYEPYRRFHAAHQRQMDTVIRQLRAQVRAQLSLNSPALAPLAALDDAFEHILGERESMLMGKLSKMLEKRFVQAVKQQLKNEAHALENGEATPLCEAWLMPWRQQLRNALLAELDTRLQPVLGLVQAFSSHTTKEQ